MYKLAGIDLSDRDIVPGQASESNLALTGAWDMPERTGKVYHEWPDEDGVEPYLRSDEIFFAGRDISFAGYIMGTSREDAAKKVQKFFNDIDAFSVLVPLECNWGTWQVYIQKEVDIEYLGQGYSKIQMTFKQPIVDLSGVAATGLSILPGIDGLSFEELGLVKMKTEKQFDRPETKKTDFTNYGTEAVDLGKRGLRQFNIRFATKQDTYSDFLVVIQNLYALFSKPGARTLKLDDGTTREVFIKDGFKVYGVRKMGEEFFAFIDVIFSEIRLLENWNRLATSIGDILVDKYGKPLTEILKKF